MDACFGNCNVILVVNSANGPFGLISRIFRKKTLINVDGLEWLRPKWKGLGARYFYFASWLSTKLYDQVINDSDEMRKVYLELFNKDSKVIAYGAHIRQSMQPELIQKWNLTENGYYLIVGRLIPDNNSDLIVDGFLQSSSKRKLVIVGDVPYQDTFATNIKNKASQDPRILFTGYVTDASELAELYHNCYCYVHGHEFGGTNPTMLKAMAYGCAILALNTPFNQEMLQNGKHGIYFEKNAWSACNSLEEIDGNAHQVDQLRETSRDGIIEKYTWDFVTRQYLAVMKKLLKIV
jgi:glycosyltransferase involved in cell wall biosynthesis